jgi:hypothetical protein
MYHLATQEETGIHVSQDEKSQWRTSVSLYFEVNGLGTMVGKNDETYKGK